MQRLHGTDYSVTLGTDTAISAPIPTMPSKVFRMDDDVPHICVYGFHILDVMEPVFGYFRSLQDSTDEYEDYLEEFFKTMKQEFEERMGKVMHEP